MADTAITATQLADILNAQNEKSAESLKELLTFLMQESKKPSALEQKKLDEEAAILLRRQTEKVALQRTDDAKKEYNRKHCSHGTYHPGTGAFHHAWVGQAHTPAGEPPFTKPFCTHCGTEIGKIYLTADQVRDGVNLHQYKGLTLAMIENWQKTSEKHLTGAAK